MACRFWFWAERADLPAIQQVVKRTGAYFISNPAAWPDGPGRVRVGICHDGAGLGDTVRGIYEITEREPEPKPQKRGWLARLFGKVAR